MTNKEKYAKEIVEIACEGNEFAVSKETGKPVRCVDMRCSLCAINLNEDKYKTCTDYRKEWAESECIKRPVISKKDRAFLDCLKNRWKYMARDGLSDAVYVFSEIPKKDKFVYSYTGEVRRASTDFNVDFPMVKWEDEEPWLIEDLKKLEVVENYE